jgi:hypothetical protein
MRTFDYETAWKELAAPMFEELPATSRNLYALVCQRDDIRQLKNLNCNFPEGFREAFDAIADEELATAARVINFYGHWAPAGKNADKTGGSWKFANLADQSLAARINPTLNRANEEKGNKIGFRIYEGFIRGWCNTPFSWTWEEIAPATSENWQRIQALASNQPPAPTGSHATREKWDTYADRAREYFGLLKAALKPAGRIAEFLETSAYMIEESEISARKAREQAADPARRQRIIDKVNDDFAATMAKEVIERDGKLWMIEHGIDIGNAIYYSHTGRWCFGWYKELAPETISALLEVLTKFPFDYDIKGYKPQAVEA